jgi:hypothetical protein
VYVLDLPAWAVYYGSGSDELELVEELVLLEAPSFRQPAIA